MSEKTKQTKNKPVMIDERLVIGFIGALTMMHEEQPMNGQSSDIYASLWHQVKRGEAVFLKQLDDRDRLRAHEGRAN
jgi:hypothetical protein